MGLSWLRLIMRRMSVGFKGQEYRNAYENRLNATKICAVSTQAKTVAVRETDELNKISEILSQPNKPALLIGNGVNRHSNSAASSWDELLRKLASSYNLELSKSERKQMSNTEFFDVLDLAKPEEDRSSLQRRFCDLMVSWQPSDHHASIANWAKRNSRPIITVNFDENLSRAIDADYFVGKGFTDWYPWSSYFSDKQVKNPKDNFAIWHAHGMVQYSRSIRLGLTHYMGAVQRARPWIYRGDEALRAAAKRGDDSWIGQNTWLEVLFFCPLMIFGFGFNKDENFLRWLFLERARLHKINPVWKTKTWFIDVPEDGSLHRKPFFERLGMEYVPVSDYPDIYEDTMWGG
jgi:hypothetical protein